MSPLWIERAPFSPADFRAFREIFTTTRSRGKRTTMKHGHFFFSSPSNDTSIVYPSFFRREVILYSLRRIAEKDANYFSTTQCCFYQQMRIWILQLHNSKHWKSYDPSRNIAIEGLLESVSGSICKWGTKISLAIVWSRLSRILEITCPHIDFLSRIKGFLSEILDIYIYITYRRNFFLILFPVGFPIRDAVLRYREWLI